MNNVTLEDTTLRDGEQAPGVAFSLQTKLEVHDLLVDAGVRWIEAGIPAMGGSELAALRAMLARGSDATLVAWNRGVRDDVAFSLDMGFRAVHIGLPASDVLLRSSVGRDRDWLLRQAADLVAYAKDRGAFVSVSAEDVGRTDIGFLQHYAGVVYEAGADRLRLSDTIGILTPEAYAERVRRVTQASPIDLQCHAHNDFGYAVANTVAGVLAGARWFHVTVNGIGERAGMPDLAQVSMSLKLHHGIDVGIRSEALSRLSRRVAAAAGHPVLPWQPLVGDNVFAHESGIHVNAMLRDPSSFEALDPATVGGERRYVLGKHSGRALVRSILCERGHQPSDEALGRLLSHTREEAVSGTRGVTAEQLVALYLDDRAVAP
jgi:homocitrate synthase NifV